MKFNKYPGAFVAIVACLVGLFHASAARAEPEKTIVLIAGVKSHGPGEHEYLKSVKLLKALLDKAPNLKGIRTEVYFNGWPDDPTVLDRADAIAFFSDGDNGISSQAPFMTEERMKMLEKQIRRGCGFMTFHYSTFAPARYAPQILEWVGGHFDIHSGHGEGGHFGVENDRPHRQWHSAIRVLETGVELGTSQHPIVSGVAPFHFRDEFYYQLTFRENDPRLRPILRVPALSQARKDQIVAWAVQRKDGGRGFGTTTGHFFDNWQNDAYRKLILNALVWTAGAGVPRGGVESTYLSEEEVNRALGMTESPLAEDPTAGGVGSNSIDLWAHDNLVAWCVVPFDAKARGPQERAQMLARLGFRHFAYDWREKDIPTFDAEIEALKNNGVNLLVWWFPLEADNPLAKQTLEVFKRHGVRPQLWVSLSGKDERWPKTPEEWQRFLPPDVSMPKDDEEAEKLSEAEKLRWRQAFFKAIARIHRENMPKTPQEQEERVRDYADRIAALSRLAAPYGTKIGLYNHNGWFGMVENQLAIIVRLAELGVTDVGMVYNFSHARDELHDDSKHFPELWEKMKPHVMAVNVTGMRWEGELVYPSQGDSELEMMRTIEKSGWRGPVGLIAEKGGDAEVTLANYRKGLDWLAVELKQPGSGGPRPC